MGQVLTNQQVNMDKLIGVDLKERQIQDFFSKLDTGDYRVILLNEQMPLLKDGLDEITISLIVGDLNENTRVELENDIMVIHTGNERNEIIKLVGYEDMGDKEIFARRYLDRCEDSLIVRDNDWQLEMDDSNFRDVEDYYHKCSDIVKITLVDENSECFELNSDAIWVWLGNGDKELWQRN